MVGHFLTLRLEQRNANATDCIFFIRILSCWLAVSEHPLLGLVQMQDNGVHPQSAVRLICWESYIAPNSACQAENLDL
jgi:hypothetical protein